MYSLMLQEQYCDQCKTKQSNNNNKTKTMGKEISSQPQKGLVNNWSNPVINQSDLKSRIIPITKSFQIDVDLFLLMVIMEEIPALGRKLDTVACLFQH